MKKGQLFVGDVLFNPSPFLLKTWPSSCEDSQRDYGAAAETVAPLDSFKKLVISGERLYWFPNSRNLNEWSLRLLWL